LEKNHVSENRLHVVNFLTVKNNIQVTPDVVGAELNNPGEFASDTNEISIARLTMDGNAGFERHVHPHNHVLAILEGSGFLVYDRGDGQDERLEFGAGDVFNVPGTNEHAVTAGPDGITMLSIGSPAMHLADPSRMVFLDEALRDMIPREIEGL
jgi:mannose-6-phosphate isomerase-like protein (cupin superfamily)